MSLSIKRPLDDYFWSIIANFSQVTFLYLLINDVYDNYRNQLQILFQRISRLSILILKEKSLVDFIVEYQELYGYYLNLLSSSLY